MKLKELIFKLLI